MDKTQAKEEAKLLLEKYNTILQKERDIKSKEEEMTKKDLIRPLFERVLGWNFEEDVTAEEKISKGWVDYGFRINGVPKFFLEAKALTEDMDNQKFFEQAVNYAYYKRCPWSVLTNFETIKILNAEWETPNYYQSRFMTITCNEFLEKFDDLWLLSKESFEQGLLDNLAEKYGKRTKKASVDKQLLNDFTKFRDTLSKNIMKLNQAKKLSQSELDESIQRILDRLIFIRNCEDRGLEEKKLWESRGEARVWRKIKEVFAYYDKHYDSKLFTFDLTNPKNVHLCDTLDIDDRVMREIIEALYRTKDKSISYDFSIIEADVLGTVYEQYLSHILKKTQKRTMLTENRTHRKEQGIYYTPSYVVDYIVRNTLGESLKNKKVDADKIRVLDCACGSGSFLIKAFDVLNEYYSRHEDYNQTQLDTTGTGVTYSKKLGILRNNIFGVDLDKQAVEIAQLNLLLKIAEKGKRLPLLEENIKCGNSLIDDEKIAGDKAFIWEEQFKNIMKEDGFDIVIGNPPYERTLYLENEKQYYSQNYVSAYGAYDILVLFIEKALRLLKDEGYLGFIVSNKFLVSDYGTKLREFLLANSKIVRIIDLADAKRVFPEALVSTVIIILQKTIPSTNYKIKRLIADKNTTTFDESQFEDIDLDKFVAQNGTFNVRYTAEKDTIYEKINRLKKFGDLFDVRTGIMGFEYWGMEPYIHEGKRSENDIRIATNSFLDRYRFLWTKEINLYKKHFTEPYANIEKMPVNEQTKKLFLIKNKLIVRGVSKRLVAMLDTEGIGFLVAVHCIQTDKEHSPKLILGILNSRLFDWIHKDRFYLGRIPEGSLKYPVSFLKQLPTPPDGKTETKEKLVESVNRMLNLQKQLGKLGDKKTDERTKLEDEIRKVDSEIDEKVYEIYGITESEKKIIESSLK